MVTCLTTPHIGLRTNSKHQTTKPEAVGQMERGGDGGVGAMNNRSQLECQEEARRAA